MDHSVATKGFTQIALGAAAGAFVAMRMNRTALLLTAGLAYAYWKKTQPEPSDVADPVLVDDLAPSFDVFSASPTETAKPEWPAPAVSLQTPFEWAVRSAAAGLNPLPVSLAEPEALPPIPAVITPNENAWADLRAAIAPVVSSPLEEKVEPSLPVSETSLGIESEPFVAPSISLAASLAEMEVCLPSSPMVPYTMDEAEVMPDGRIIGSQADPMEEDIPQSLLFEAEDEFNPTPQPLQQTETLIVSKFTTQAIDADSLAKDGNLTAPIVVPKDSQARKSFFTWLRG